MYLSVREAHTLCDDPFGAYCLYIRASRLDMRVRTRAITDTFFKKNELPFTLNKT